MAKLNIEIESDQILLREYCRKSWKNSVSIPPSPAEEDNRLLLDGLITPQEAKALVQFAERNVIAGAGYGEKHPHSQNELFSSYTVTGKVTNADGFDLLVKLQYRILRIVATYFQDYDIDIMFSQVAARKALVESPLHETQSMSHSFHLDINPSDQETRTHTAILFLNDDVIGGKFMFKENSYAPRRVITPKPGRLIAFKAPGTFHGISHIYSGTRYVFAFWFTSREKR